MTRTGNNYGLFVDLPGAVDHWRPRVEDLLKEHGFGVLTEIDVKATIKMKLDEDVPPQFILGACNPPLAHRALTEEPAIGLLLPCNVVVTETEAGDATVSALDPVKLFALVGRPELEPVAREVRERLVRVIEAL